MTEKEAKMRRCCGPMAAESPVPNCRASDCMAWRFHPQDHEEFWTLDGAPTWPGHPYTLDDSARMKRETRPLPRTGYCGLAGIPERA